MKPRGKLGEVPPPNLSFARIIPPATQAHVGGPRLIIGKTIASEIIFFGGGRGRKGGVFLTGFNFGILRYIE